MKLLKIWGRILLAVGVLIHFYGMLSGVFTSWLYVLLAFGSSPKALFLHALSIVFVVLPITILLISSAISDILAENASVERNEEA